MLKNLASLIVWLFQPEKVWVTVVLWCIVAVWQTNWLAA
jgi:hypothetical protein